MRTSKLLRRISILGMLLCTAVSFGQTGAPAIPLISQVTPPSIAPSPNPNLIVQFSLTILGANFPSNAVVKLTVPQGPSIYPASTSVNANGTQIVAQFNTTLPRPAVYAVTVTNASNNPTAVSNVFYLPITPSATTVEISQNLSGFLSGELNAMAIGDFNGDGNVDVAVVSQNANTVSILLGTFGGFLNPGAAYPTGNGPAGIVAADFNGDGVLDLAYSNSGDNTITILLGNGDGTFRPGSIINDPGVYPTQIAAADFNGDGVMDLAVLNVCAPVAPVCYPQIGPQGLGTVAILLGSGDGTFSAAPNSPATGSSPSAIAAADLNADGAIDLIVANRLDNNVTLLMGNGNGTFVAALSTVATGSFPSAIAVADLNGDGKLDLAVANTGGNTVSILLNQNCVFPAAPVNCTFSGTPFSPAVGVNPIAISAGDMNADGSVDLVVANAGSNSISVLLGDGTGGFTAVVPQQPAKFSTGQFPSAMALADFSGDGRLDVATVSASGSYSTLMQTAVPQVVLTTGNSAPIYGMNVTFTANVNPSFGAQPTGSVTLYDGTNSLGTVALSGYQANFFISTLVVGTHQVTATYNGDANFLASTSASVTETVSQAQTNLTLTSNVNTLPYGQPFTLSATVVISNLGSPTGTVSFFELFTSTFLGTAPVTNGVAQLTLSTLAPGAHVITASYGGDSNFLGSSSPTYTENITQASTTITVATSASPVNLGQTPTFTATIQPSAITGATGFVAFFADGSTALGAATISNNSAQLRAPVLSVGPHAITAQFTGDVNYTSSLSSPILELVNPAADTVNVSTSTTVYGQAATFVATVQGINYSGMATGTMTFSDGSTVLGIAPLSNGSAQFTTSGLAVGTHPISASYSGDANFQAATSAQANASVLRASATAVVASAPNPSAFSQAVNLTATVQPAFGGAATGSVTFLDGSVTLGTSTLSGNVAVFSISSFTVGTHSISAAYAGDNNVNGSVSAAMTQTVNPSPTSVTLTSNANPSTYGQNVTFAATVNASFGIAPGSIVSFYDGTTLLGSVNSATAPPQITIFFLTGGTHSITAQYAGNSNFASSTSTALTQTVNQASTTTTVFSIVNPSSYGQSVTITASVDSTYHVNSSGGTVTFYDNGVPIGSSIIQGSGVNLTISTLAAGAHSITASYGGDANLVASSSAAFTQTVNQAAVSPTIALSSYATAYGQSITMTTNLRPANGGSPTGTVTFMDRTTALGTANVVNGSAQFSYSALAPGSHYISAAYNGDANFAAGSSGQTLMTVSQATSTTVAAVDVNPANYGQTVTMSATVQSSGGTPTGSVTFLDGSSTLGTVALANGAAQLAVSSLGAGSHSLTAKYSGDTNFSPSTSAALAETVNQLVTTTSLASSLNPAPAGQSVTFTATVQGGTGNSVSGTITLLDGSTNLGTAGVSNNSAQLTISTLAPGSHAITAVYSGNTNFSGSTSSALTETVNLITTTTTLAASANPALAGGAVTFTATVQAGTGNSATGTVNFMDGSSTLGTATVANNTAQLTVSTLAVGPHAIAAVYSGSTNFGGSTSSALTETVNQSGTTTTLVSNLNPATFGQGIPFVATVQTASGGAATGTVTFYDGATVLATVPVVNNNSQHNVAQLTFAGMLGGAHAITAAYGGDANYVGSTSNALTETINPASSSVTIGASSNPASYGQAVTLTATVVPAISGDLASGAVTFFDGSTSLGAANLSNNAAQISLPSFAAGSHPITASYAGDRNFAGNTSAVLAETVNPAATSTALTSSANPALVGASVTFTAAVSSSIAGAQSGTVSFYLDGSGTASATVALSSGASQYSTNSLSAGSHTVVAVFASTNANFVGSSSGTLTQSVSDFTLTVSPSSLTLARNNVGTYTLTITSVGGFSGTVSLSCSGAPTNAPCAISPLQVSVTSSGSAQSTATISVNKHASTGTHTLTFTGTSGSLTHKQTATLVIN